MSRSKILSLRHLTPSMQDRRGRIACCDLRKREKRRGGGARLLVATGEKRDGGGRLRPSQNGAIRTTDLDGHHRANFMNEYANHLGSRSAMHSFIVKRSLAAKTSDRALSLTCKVSLELQVPDAVRDRCPSTDVLENLDIVVGDSGRIALRIHCHAFGVEVNGADLVQDVLVSVSLQRGAASRADG